jgi:hypothetical protein
LCHVSLLKDKAIWYNNQNDLAEILLNFNPEIESDAESLIRKEINSWNNKISNLIKNIKGEVEISLAHGILNESEKNNFEAKFTIIESKVNDCLRFDLLNSELNSVRTFCDRKKEQEIEIVRKQFNLIDLKLVEESAINGQPINKVADKVFDVGNSEVGGSEGDSFVTCVDYKEMTTGKIEAKKENEKCETTI